MKIRPGKNSGLYGSVTHDLCDTGAVLYQLSWQANWKLVILWVRYNTSWANQLSFYLPNKVFVRMRVLYLRRLRSTTLIPPNVRFETRDQTIPPNFDEVSEKGKNCELDKHFLKKRKFSRKKGVHFLPRLRRISHHWLCFQYFPSFQLAVIFDSSFFFDKILDSSLLNHQFPCYLQRSQFPCLWFWEEKIDIKNQLSERGVPSHRAALRLESAIGASWSEEPALRPSRQN